MKRPPARIEAALNKTGISWTIKDGSKHHKIFLGGHLVGILPRCAHKDEDWQAVRNVVGQIRRKAKALNGEAPMQEMA